MASSEEIRKHISIPLDEEDDLRERAYSLSRELIRECRSSISKMVRSGKGGDLKGPFEVGGKLNSILDRHYLFRYNFIEDGFTELAEAVILSRTLDGKELPLPEEVNLSPRAYILGVCDAVGELRRVALNNLIAGDVDRARAVYDQMKELSSLIEGFVYPSGMIQLKKKQDMVRGVVDRTGGELSSALYSHRTNNSSGDLINE
ncbi:MAG: hypothetical protein KAH57_10700 [Thermoplasmata archaeon]|nr:hypothetical protein [Thermoplasmata archaeon]